MNKKASLTLSALLLAVLGLLFGPQVLEGARTDAGARVAEREDAPTNDATSAKPAPPDPSSPASAVDERVGFTSKRSLEEHYAKHGREFGSITQAQYLRLAQELRDAPVGGPVREATRDDRVITRFDTRSGAFLAFHADKTIRTFFKPNDGLRYFERQLDQEHR